jgi:hypothetical protein
VYIPEEGYVKSLNDHKAIRVLADILITGWLQKNENLRCRKSLLAGKEALTGRGQQKFVPNGMKGKNFKGGRTILQYTSQ